MSRSSVNRLQPNELNKWANKQLCGQSYPKTSIYFLKKNPLQNCINFKSVSQATQISLQSHLFSTQKIKTKVKRRNISMSYCVTTKRSGKHSATFFYIPNIFYFFFGSKKTKLWLPFKLSLLSFWKKITHTKVTRNVHSGKKICDS